MVLVSGLGPELPGWKREEGEECPQGIGPAKDTRSLQAHGREIPAGISKLYPSCHGFLPCRCLPA